MVKTLGTISFALNPKRAHFVTAARYSMRGLAISSPYQRRRVPPFCPCYSPPRSIRTGFPPVIELTCPHCTRYQSRIC